MIFWRGLLPLLLISSSSALTTLSTNNCPANFDITTANLTASSTNSAADLLYANIYSSSEQSDIQAAFASGDSVTITSKLSSLAIMVPFILVAFAFSVTFTIALCCCIFEKTCPPCQSLKRDFGSRPYERSEMKCVTIFALLFAGGIAITSLVGFIFFPALSTDIENTKCGLYTTLDVALNGDQTNNWGGFKQISSQIGNVSSQLSTASTAVSTDLSNNEWLLTSMQALKEQNLNLYKRNFQSTVLSPNSATTLTAITGSNPLPTITPLFISAGLGPNGTANTMVTDLDAGIQVTQAVSTQAYKVYTFALLLASSANTINANLNSAINSMSLNEGYLNSILVSIDSFSASMFDSVFNWGLYLIQAILGFVLAASLLLILGVISTHYLGLYSCRTSVHLGWVTYGATYLGIVILCFIFFSLGGISYQFCEFYGSLIKNDSSFNKFAGATGPNEFNRFFQKLNTCFYGTGNVMGEFSISQQTATISNLYSQINSYLDMRDATKTTYVDMTSSPTKITNWATAMSKYRLGIYIDADPADLTFDNPQISLAKFNTYANNATGGTPPSCTNDHWVFDVANCTNNATQAQYTISSTSGTTFATTGSTCISFNSKFQTASSAIWSISDLSARYVGRRQCDNNIQSYTNILNYGTALINYRDSRINLYQNLQDQLNALLLSNNNFNTNVDGFTAKVNTFVASTQTMNTLVTNAINGLDASSDCRTLANNLRFVYNAFCLNFMYSSVKFGICCLVLLALMVGGTLTGCVFGVRYGRVQKDTRAVHPETPSMNHLKDMHSETFERRENSSSSSSSSDED